jgi:hypothetical protein
MVNLASGDLAYNLPLLEVPGPSGGYPLSLSYHAGILPNEEASWVGLGWTLNPGAITRSVNGFADDFSNQPNAARFYWKGGETKTYEIGVTIGLGETGVSAGLEYSQDTYQGAGLGMSIGFNGGAFKDGPGASARIGISPYGDPYASAGVSLSIPLGEGLKGLSIGGGLSVATNFKSTSVSAGASVSYRNDGGTGNDNTDDVGFSMLGASISTSAQGTSVGVNSGDFSTISNSRAGKISTSTGGANITIPLPGISVSIGAKYTRYWIDQIDKVYVNGALNYPDGPVDWHFYEDHAYDTYSLLDQDSSVADNSEPSKVLGGSFPNFDNFLVHAQGLAGAMRPYYFQKHLVNRHDFNIEQDDQGDDYNEYKTIQLPLGYDSRKAEFRFVGEFSNRYEYTPPSMKQLNDPGYGETNPMGLTFANGALAKGESGVEAYTNNRLPGSRHIEYLLNQEIGTEHAREVGFIETVSTGFSRSAQLSKAIGAMLITNESGVKYHFSLPAMASMEYSYSENTEGTTTFNELKNPNPYAYTWYLTALTGPDYVDRGPNGSEGDGILNEYDWGYWVEFEYGKWTDQYFWRNPSEGGHTDIDGKFKTFSEGRKELYFLDAIRTKSHTAYFVKDIRHDAKSTIYSLRNISNRGLKKNKESITSFTKDGGFKVKQITNTCNRIAEIFPMPNNQPSETTAQSGSITYYSRPTSSLKLVEVVLVQNKDIVPVSKLMGTAYEQKDEDAWTITENETFPSDCETCDFSNVKFNHHLYQNVLDIYDFQTAAGTTLKSKAIRSVKFDTDYSLAPYTSNSFDFNLVKSGTPDVNQVVPTFGKLTLNKVHFLGKAGATVIPPMNFGYDVAAPIEATITLNKPDPYKENYTFTLANSGFKSGDIVKFTNGYAFIQKVDDVSGLHTLKLISGIAYSGQIVHVIETKNPPYHKDRTDIWGLYKADLDGNLLATNEAAARLVSPASAKAIDVWSLRNVQSSLGSKIQITYEPDSYKKPVLVINNGLRVENLRQKTNSNNWELVLYDNIEGLDQLIRDSSNLEFTYFMADPYYENLGDHGFGDEVDKLEIPVYATTYENNKWVVETQNLSSLFVKRPNEGNLTFYTPQFIAGNLSLHEEATNYGGGIRVKSIQTSGYTATKQTSYEYTINDHNEATTGDLTSGVTAYEPGGMDHAIFNFPQPPSSFAEFFENEDDKEEAVEAYKQALVENFSNLLTNAREIPSPGVVYEYVTVREKIIHSNGEEVEIDNHSTYNFQVFKKGMMDILYEDYNEDSYPTEVIIAGADNANDVVKSRRVVLKNFSASVGTLKTVSLYDKQGRILSKTTNHYLNDDIIAQLTDENFASSATTMEQRIRDQFKGQGIVEETYTEAKYVKQDYTKQFRDVYHLLGTVSKREEFPNINIGQTTINYKTGIESKSTNLGFDFYTGAVVQSTSTDGYGNTFLTQSVPAHTVYPGMGLLANGGKNMLTQQAASYTYKVDVTQNNKPIAIVAASATTWSDQIVALQETQAAGQAVAQPGVWRMRGSYSYVGDDQVSLRPDGLHIIDLYNPNAHKFTSWTSGVVQPGWQRNSQISLYDVNSHALEVEDINQLQAATKYSNDQAHIFATVANAGYEEFAYSGAEEARKNSQFGGNVVAAADGVPDIEHTGDKSLLASAGSRSFTYTFNPKKRTYRVSFWASQPSAAVKFKIDNGVTASATVNHIGQGGSWHLGPQAGAWHLLEADIVLTNDPGQLEVWVEAGTSGTYFDDFRICPLDAAMSSYVYNQYGELSHILGGNNQFTEFTYDAMGRLIKTRQETLNYGIVKTSENTYHYADQN